MYTSQRVYLAQSISRTLTKQYWMKFLGLIGHHLTPSNAYTKRIDLS